MSSPGLIVSCDLEDMAARRVAGQQAPGADVLRPETVVVPSQGMAQWLPLVGSFDQDAAYRPDWIESWEQGGRPARDPWQAELWRVVREDRAAAHPGRLMGWLVKEGARQARLAGVSERTTVGNCARRSSAGKMSSPAFQSRGGQHADVHESEVFSPVSVLTP